MKKKFLVVTVLVFVIVTTLCLAACSNDGIKKPSGPPKDVESLVDSMLYYKNFTFHSPFDTDYYVTQDAIMRKSRAYKDKYSILKKDGKSYYKYDIIFEKNSSPIIGINDSSKEEFDKLMQESCEDLLRLKKEIKDKKYNMSDLTNIVQKNDNGYTYKYIYKSNKLTFESYDSNNVKKVEEVRYDSYNETKIDNINTSNAYKNCVASKYISFLVENHGIKWFDIKNDGTTVTFDTNPFDTSSWDDSLIYNQLKSFFKSLGLSQSIFSQMEQTTALDGLRTANEGDYTIEWRFHPSYGLSGMIYE